MIHEQSTHASMRHILEMLKMVVYESLSPWNANEKENLFEPKKLDFLSNNGQFSHGVTRLGNEKLFILMLVFIMTWIFYNLNFTSFD